MISRLVLPDTFIVPLSSPLLLHKTLLELRVSTFYTSIFMAQQLNSVLSDMHVDVVKTGMLPSLGIVKVLCQNLRKFLDKGLYGQHNVKKPKIMKQPLDNPLDNNALVTNSIPSPAASQMSNMSNPNKFIKIISVRDRGRKAKALKVNFDMM
ncbi:hypothetical protein RJT34_13137 [Clitoria ternatea]|uniref:Pyridoxamine kinase/Phosphomethylpyrimidine kinase domain-containing protein n=1 Tax=Clitoria ternatea TaxID=43366 RepID=A0AAN9PM14_CLITE